MAISEAQAWQIVEEFARDLAAALGDQLLSVVVIGGLGAGTGEMIWDKESALRSFAEREPGHPHVAVVQKLIQLGRDDPALNLPIGPQAVALWRAVHKLRICTDSAIMAVTA